jgi:hypothetical protein
LVFHFVCRFFVFIYLFNDADSNSYGVEENGKIIS